MLSLVDSSIRGSTNRQILAMASAQLNETISFTAPSTGSSAPAAPAVITAVAVVSSVSDFTGTWPRITDIDGYPAFGKTISGTPNRLRYNTGAWQFEAGAFLFSVRYIHPATSSPLPDLSGYLTLMGSPVDIVLSHVF